MLGFRADALSSKLDLALDAAEHFLCRAGIRKSMTWNDLERRPIRRLYAGRLRRGLPQYSTHYGITPFFASSRNLFHDVAEPYPIAGGSIDAYQSEDVFEHLPLDRFVPVLNEIHRVLKPGAVFRLSLPDYNFDVYRDRTQRAEDGSLRFDPMGGGSIDADGTIRGGGHLWFPTIDLVRALIEQSGFAGQAEYLQYANPDGSSVLKPIDYSTGYIQRTADHDARVRDRRRAVSIVVDMTKA
jgi:SAM-dependent methyltransferase